ncbi:MAG: methyl-accepting chemotaxis protein [Methanomicrobiales archaeon]|nr:methyl-accepting chemotaxis protein [Methanomicrobiales archaeon]
MSFIDNISIGKKLTAGFLILVAIAVAIAGIGFVVMGSMSASADRMYNENLMKLDYLTSADASFLNMRVNTYKLVWAQDEAAEKLPESAEELKNIEARIQLYKTKSLSAEEKEQLAVFDRNFPQYAAAYQVIAQDLQAGNTPGAIAGIRGDGFKVPRDAAEDALKNLQQYNRNEAKTLRDQILSNYQSTTILFLVMTIGTAIFGISLGLYLTRSITTPIEAVKHNITEIHKGHLTQRLNLNRRDEVGEMADTMDQFSEELQKYVIGTLKMMAEGDLSRNLKPRDDKDEIVPALMLTVHAVRDLVTEATTLSQAAVEGRLATRGNEEKFKGSYREVIRGVNQTLDAVVVPVNEAMRVSGDYANGDFTARFDRNVMVRGDFVKLREALDNIGIEVAKSLHVINQQASELAASAQEASASVQEVSAGSAQVARNASGVSVNAEKATLGVNQVQKAMEDLSHTIQDVATKSELVAKLVEDTTTFSRQGMDLAQKTESGMQGITRSSDEVNQIILEIKGQMDKISEIIRLITDLANQTNLLALNAAIEAARAGDAGRGFAVVATEVKSLAVESRSSAERIAAMIENLQKETQNAVAAVSAANAGVQDGSRALHETLSSFTRIAESIDKINQNVNEVASAAEEQAASVQEVTASISEVGGLMQGTTKEAADAAAASQESSAAIEQITKVVGNVNVIVDNVTKEVSRFRV